MATIRELVTKLTMKADLSGVKQALAGVRKLANETVKADQKTVASTKKTAKYTESAYVKNLRAKVSAIREQLQTEKAAARQSVYTFKKKASVELAYLKAVNREKLRQSKAMGRQRRSNARERGTIGGGGRMPSGIGLGSIISGNVIANAITAGIRSATQAVIELSAGLVNAAADVEKVQAEFGVMLGSDAKALALIDDLQRKAADTPLQFKDLAKNSRILLQYGSNADDVVKQLTMIGDVVGGDSVRFDFMTFAFAQMMSAGKLMGQELRQMTNAGFNPLEQMAKKTGKTMIELRKDMEMGRISSEDVIEAFRMATSDGGRFFKNMERQAKTFHGRVSTMKDEFYLLAVAMGERLLPGMKNVVNQIIDFVKNGGRQIGINLMDSILPALQAVITGVERFVRVMFDIDGIGKMLKDKDALGEYFRNLAKRMDDAFIYITAGALQMKMFLMEVGPTIAASFKIALQAIQLVIRHLPTLIKLWVAFKALQIAGTIAGITVAIMGLLSKLFMFAKVNPLLLAVTAALASIGFAAQRIFESIDERKSHEERMRAADAYNKKMDYSISQLNAYRMAEAALKKQLATDMMSAADRASAEISLAGLQTKIANKTSEIQGYQHQAAAALGGTNNKSFLGDIQSLLSNISNIGNITASDDSAFDKLLEKVRKTHVTQNFFNNVDIKTDITNEVPKDTKPAEFGALLAKHVEKMYNEAWDRQVTHMQATAAQ